MREHKRMMVRAAELLEQQAFQLREANMVWNGSHYEWGKGTRGIRRLHDDAERHALTLRRMAR